MGLQNDPTLFNSILAARDERLYSSIPAKAGIQAMPSEQAIPRVITEQMPPACARVTILVLRSEFCHEPLDRPSAIHSFPTH